jgi:signal transduction histidine kinase
VRRRIIATVTAACAVAVVLLFLPAAGAVRDREHRAEVSELERDAMVVASRLPADPLTVSGVFGDGRHRYGLYDAAGRLVAGRGPDPGDPVVRRALTDIVVDGKLGEDLVAAVPLAAIDGRPAAVLRAEEPAAHSVARIRMSIARLGAVALVALVVAGVAGWLLVRRLTKPLEVLTDVAARIGHGDFSAAAPVTGLSQLDQLGDALRASAARVNRLLSRERAFSADASHQLRTPLAALRSTLETELYAPRADARLAVQESLEVVERLERTVGTLLDLARDAPPDRTDIDLDARLDDAARRWQRSGSDAGRTITVVGDAAGESTAPHVAPRAYASSSAVDHILDVLLENALHHGEGPVRLRTSRRHGVAVVEVLDDGAVTPAEAGRLFERHESRRGSTGIGLHLARVLAEAEGGRLRLASADPTCFELLLRSPDIERATGEPVAEHERSGAAGDAPPAALAEGEG